MTERIPYRLMAAITRHPVAGYTAAVVAEYDDGLIEPCEWAWRPTRWLAVRTANRFTATHARLNLETDWEFPLEASDE